MKKLATLQEMQTAGIVNDSAFDYYLEEYGNEFCFYENLHPGNILHIFNEHGSKFDITVFIQYFEEWYNLNSYFMETISGESDGVQNAFVEIEYLQLFLSVEHKKLTDKMLSGNPSEVVKEFGFKTDIANAEILRFKVTRQIQTMKNDLLDGAY